MMNNTMSEYEKSKFKTIKEYIRRHPKAMDDIILEMDMYQYKLNDEVPVLIDDKDDRGYLTFIVDIIYKNKAVKRKEHNFLVYKERDFVDEGYIRREVFDKQFKRALKQINIEWVDCMSFYVFDYDRLVPLYIDRNFNKIIYRDRKFKRVDIVNYCFD